jgi:Bacterial PH domain
MYTKINNGKLVYALRSRREFMRTQEQDRSPITRYAVKKDGWLVFLIVLAFLLPFLLGITLLITQPHNANNPIAGGLFAVVVGIGCWMFFFMCMYPSYYEITVSSLVVKSGRYHKVIPLSSIQKVYKPGVVSHATWSFDQLRVDYRVGKQSFLRALFVAPEDKSAFLHGLVERAGDLEMVDDTLVRRR